MKSGNTSKHRDLLLVALGGNALIRKGQRGTIEEQFENLRLPMSQIARLSSRYRIVVTHGNGPQVGNLMLQQELSGAVPQLPLEILVAQTQGQIGYMIESTLDGELMKIGRDKETLLVSLLSYVVVDDADPAFLNPSKPVGPCFPEEMAARLPYLTVSTPRGRRRVVASPKPLSIVEKREIRELLSMGFIVISCGGGGIPVVRASRGFHGVDAVIDKDLASAKLAEEVGVDLFVIATDVEGVALSFGKPGQQFLRTLGLSEAARYLAKGEFSAGSMGPKVEAAAEFVRNGGKRAVVTSLEAIEAAVEGRAGTEFVRDEAP